MQTVTIVCVGKLKENYWVQACEEYQKRLKPYCKFAILELPEAKLPKNPSPGEIQIALEQEGKQILEAIGSAVCIPLCIEGRLFSSEQLSQRLEQLACSGQSKVAFVIGSSHGLAECVKAKGQFRFSMSPMTFPHQLARVLLCEQIYRAFQIQQGSPYHK